MPRLALVQQIMSDKFEENVDKGLFLLEEAARKGADLIVFPEIQFSPFFPQYLDRDASAYLIDVCHPAVQRFQRTCKATGVVAVLNFYLRENGQCFDASPVIDRDGSILGISKMVHIVQTANFYEQSYYSPARDGFKVYRTPVGLIGVVICFDRHFPESIRSCALQGAQLIVIPTANTIGEPLEMFEWEARVAAFQNTVYVAMCNRVGVEGNMSFCGESVVVDPNGQVVAKANDKEQVLLAEYDLELQKTVAANRPYVKLLHPEANVSLNHSR